MVIPVKTTIRVFKCVSNDMPDNPLYAEDLASLQHAMEQILGDDETIADTEYGDDYSLTITVEEMDLAEWETLEEWESEL